MANLQGYGGYFRVSRDMARDSSYLSYLQHEINKMEKDAIYAAVKQVRDSWICIKPEIVQEETWDGFEYRVRVHVREVKEVGVRVYIPVYDAHQMPPDVFECKFCGGMTKNDMRGHCSGCGGPRNNNYLSH